jgi:hypothetical protein
VCAFMNATFVLGQKDGGSLALATPRPCSLQF